MKVDRLKVLIIGGYGTFGGRLAQLLADEDRLTLVIGGRSQAKAAAFCAGLHSRATAVPLAFDRDRAIEPQLRQIAPDIVVDATGPFQSYGADRYRGVMAALALGINWAPRGKAYEFAAAGRFHFHVEIAHPLMGLIVRYQGWLEPRA